MTLSDYSEEKLQELSKDDTRLIAIGRGISALKFSKVFEILREFGRVRSVSSSTEAIILENGRSSGYNEALEDLERFLEKYIHSRTETPQVPIPEYGGMEIAKQHGDLSDKEIDELRKSFRPYDTL